MESRPLSRHFEFNGVRLPDISPQLSPEEIFPDNILARTPDLLVWWSRTQRRVMFFGGTD
jgi:hypothetical protein